MGNSNVKLTTQLIQIKIHCTEFIDNFGYKQNNRNLMFKDLIKIKQSIHKIKDKFDSRPYLSLIEESISKTLLYMKNEEKIYFNQIIKNIITIRDNILNEIYGIDTYISSIKIMLEECLYKYRNTLSHLIIVKKETIDLLNLAHKKQLNETIINNINLLLKNITECIVLCAQNENYIDKLKNSHKIICNLKNKL